MKRLISLTLILLATFVSSHASHLTPHVSYADGAITIDGDPMAWTLKTDGSQYAWVTDRYAWGQVYYDPAPVTVNVDRRQQDDDLVETYTFTNSSTEKVTLKNVGIYTPFNDNYPNAKTCMTSRCNAHIWPGGRAAWVNALRMSGKGPHLGLMVTEGEITDYDVWERGSDKGMSNFRGVLALCPPDMTLAPGKSYRLTWRLFAHNGDDFEKQLLRRGGTVVTSDKYVYALGETARVSFTTAKGTKTISRKLTQTGEVRVDYKGAHALLLAISSERELMDKRVRFILDHQQFNRPGDPRDGAFMIYDNEGDSILTSAGRRSDLSEGRERIGMGIMLAAYALRERGERREERGERVVEGTRYGGTEVRELTAALHRYAQFVRKQLQATDYYTKSDVKGGKDRGYNYAWVADFYFRMALLTLDSDATLARQYALDGYGTLRALYRHFGYGFYCIDYPVLTGLDALAKTGLLNEMQFLLYDFQQTGDIFVKNGLNFPAFEVNYEQSIIAPAVQFLCELYLVTGNKRYLLGAQLMMPALEALGGQQPSYRMHEIAIRHWDGYWFGKRQTYGDVFPHYWSCITAAAYHRYAQATERSDYQQRAEQIVRGNLSLFFEDGRATCAFVSPRRVNGETAHYADVLANDQDWALMWYLLVNDRTYSVPRRTSL